MPQSMQRAPCSLIASPASGSAYSSKSWTRSAIGRLRGSTRWISMKPPSLPMAREHLLRGLVSRLRLLGLARARRARGLGAALGGDRRVLVLPGLAHVAALVGGVGPHRRPRLAGRDRARPGAVAALPDDGELAGLHRLLLRQLAQRALVVHRHALDPRRAQLVRARERALGDGRAGALHVLGHQRADLPEVLLARL